MVLAQPVPSGARPLRARDRDAAMSAVPGEVLIEVEAAAKTGAAVNQSYTVEPESPTT